MEQSDEDLVRAYIEGDESAFSSLLARHLPAVYSFLFRFVGDADEAQDIAQETFVKIWKNLKRYDVSRSHFKTWAFNIARNAGIDSLRKKKHIPFSRYEKEDADYSLAETLPDNAPGQELLLEQELEKENLYALLAELPLPQREVLLLRHEEGLTFEEVSQAIDQPLNTVKSRHRRALMALRTLAEAQRETRDKRTK